MTEKYDAIISGLQNKFPGTQWTKDQVLTVAGELGITTLPLVDMLNLRLLPTGEPFTESAPTSK